VPWLSAISVTLQVVNTTAALSQYQESVAGLASGKILVTWSDNLENAVFHGLHTGSLDAAAFNAGPHAADANDRIIYNRANGTLFFDSDGIGGHAQVEFAVLTNKPLLTNVDLAVI
jgi:Ca2+-binding RTX toxin-like protein